MTRKAQSSMEFMGVALVGLLLFVPIFILALDFLGSESFDNAVGRARVTADSLADAADSMCVQPNGSKTEVVAAIPGFIDGSQSSIDGRTIRLALRQEDNVEFVSANSKCSLIGSLPSTSGTYIFIVEKETAAVNITARTA